MSRSSAEVRRAFLDYFQSKGHEVIASGPLVPQNDPTLMFANAGMVPFKDVFVGKESRAIRRATSSQKCIRISGKHNDLENVGVTARHHTFFEMLGNFSFGDYFKEEAIAYAWELLTKVYALDTSRMMITVFGGEQGLAPDDEARALWRKVTGFGDDRIVGLGMKDNFWQMGETGPCGPCTEIHWYNGDAAGAAGNDVPYGAFGDEPTADGAGWVEIWNLVFMQYERSIEPSGGASLTPLPRPCVDTGAGLERMTSALGGMRSNYDTDLLRALVAKASEVAGKRYNASQGDDDVSMRVIADHARMAAFTIAEGVFPDRAGREYILRRVMRRAIRHGHRLGIREPFLHEVALEVVRVMGDQYPELERRKELIASVAQAEEIRFRETIERGLKMLEEELAGVRSSGGAVIRGETAFRLYDTYGFPLDLTQVIAQERGFSVDEEAFNLALGEQRARSEGSKLNDEAAVEGVWRKVLEDLTKTSPAGVKFVGYEREASEGTVVAIVRGAERIERASEGEDVVLVTDVTPFYGESGGQAGDAGLIERRGAEPMRMQVDDTQKPVPGLVLHAGRIAQGSVALGDAVHLVVDHERRTATRRNHSATHLLHWALRTVLGEQATQKGSLVSADRLRFDFSYGKALTPEELTRIEDKVNAKVLADAPVLTEVLPIEEARKRGATAIFEEKYGDVVRMLTMTPDSVELCGGTHARSLGEIGLFKIVTEQGLAAGVRRIEAVTGLNALAYLRGIESTLRGAARAVKASPAEVQAKIEKLLEREKQLDREVADLKRQVAVGGAGQTGGLDEILRSARKVEGGHVLAVKLPVGDAATLRETAEKLRDKLGDAIVLVGAAGKDKAMLVLTVSKSLTGKYHAGDLVKGIAQIVGGSGGGRPDMAQAGGTQIDRLDEALESLYAQLT
ncbi:MAG TPA: alanine--tRNA ligase [Polyangiaceae bacterium]|nr:alanine--tRNA ligase [Polyangiaceae bacterium]